ncbi:MAG: carotenoid biosynthesis protein [Gemmatimonadaceae bacterium]
MGMTGSQRYPSRFATVALVGHVALILFSTVALTTFLASPTQPAWLQSEPNATVYRLGWKFSGPTYVVLGALAALLHAWGKLGARRAWALFFTGSLVSLGSELLGTSTGFPFGSYAYTTLLGYRIANLVPFPIPISWFYMIYGSLAICGRLLPARDDARTKLGWALVAGAVLTAWDVSMDPAMVRTVHWVWAVKGAYYGMPWSNWVGWYLTGTLIARLMLAIAPPTTFARLVSPSVLPIALYAANGVMPVALCFRDGMPLAAILGTLAMATPVALALAPRALRFPASAQVPLPAE